jgi:hypothetical protein
LVRSLTVWNSLCSLTSKLTQNISHERTSVTPHNRSSSVLSIVICHSAIANLEKCCPIQTVLFLWSASGSVLRLSTHPQIV